MFSLIFVFAFSSLCSCAKIDFNAKIIKCTLNENYKKSVKTYGAYYYDENLAKDDEKWDNNVQDTTSPKFVLEVIENVERQNEIFDQIENIDYSKETAVIYAYTTFYAKKQILTKIELLNYY